MEAVVIPEIGVRIEPTRHAVRRFIYCWGNARGPNKPTQTLIKLVGRACFVGKKPDGKSVFNLADWFFLVQESEDQNGAYSVVVTCWRDEQCNRKKRTKPKFRKSRAREKACWRRIARTDSVQF